MNAISHTSMKVLNIGLEFSYINVIAICIPNRYSEPSSLMSKSFQLRQLFIQASRHKPYQNKWYGDNVWGKILEQNYNSGPITKKEINTALSNAILDDDLTLICNKRKVTNEENKKVNGMFYFIANKQTNYKQIHDVPVSMWQDIYNCSRIPRNNKRLRLEGKLIVE